MTPTASDIVMFVTTHGYNTTSINYVQKVLDSASNDAGSATLAHIAAEAQAAASVTETK